ncbi:hypothetical protein ScalyP_jg4533 [Parmales sp. scaly parma]|nr:hypothetical protein ScalyP_jg4533 [Parmales sp. scaly parma]
MRGAFWDGVGESLAGTRLGGGGRGAEGRPTLARGLGGATTSGKCDAVPTPRPRPDRDPFLSAYGELKGRIEGLVTRVSLAGFFEAGEAEAEAEANVDDRRRDGGGGGGGGGPDGDGSGSGPSGVLSSCLSLVLTAGTVLSNLESPSRSVSTEELLGRLRETREATRAKRVITPTHRPPPNPPALTPALTPTLLVDSLAYLLYKVDLTHRDVADAKLVAGSYFLKANGGERERTSLLRELGAADFDSVADSRTSDFVRRGQLLASSLPPSHPIPSPEATVKVFSAVASLLFSPVAVPLPPVFGQDGNAFAEAREVATVVAVGAAIAAHARSMSGGSAPAPPAFAAGGGGEATRRHNRHTPHNEEEEEERIKLVNGAKNEIVLALTGARHQGSVKFADVVEGAVSLYLAVGGGGGGRAPPPDLKGLRESLAGRVEAILKGTDAVVKVYHGRKTLTKIGSATNPCTSPSTTVAKSILKNTRNAFELEKARTQAPSSVVKPPFKTLPPMTLSASTALSFGLPLKLCANACPT